MAWYYMSVNEGPGHASHWEDWFYSEDNLSEEELKYVLEQFYYDKDMEYPIGEITEVTEIPTQQKRWLRLEYEHQIDMAQKALKALDLLSEVAA